MLKLIKEWSLEDWKPESIAKKKEFFLQNQKELFENEPSSMVERDLLIGALRHEYFSVLNQLNQLNQIRETKELNDILEPPEPLNFFRMFLNQLIAQYSEFQYSYVQDNTSKIALKIFEKKKSNILLDEKNTHKIFAHYPQVHLYLVLNINLFDAHLQECIFFYTLEQNINVTFKERGTKVGKSYQLLWDIIYGVKQNTPQHLEMLYAEPQIFTILKHFSGIKIKDKVLYLESENSVAPCKSY